MFRRPGPGVGGAGGRLTQKFVEKVVKLGTIQRLGGRRGVLRLDRICVLGGLSHVTIPLHRKHRFL